jgi:hypothetical protein
MSAQAEAVPDNVVPIAAGRRRPADRSPISSAESGARWLAAIRADLDAIRQKRTDERQHHRARTVTPDIPRLASRCPARSVR